MIELPENFDSIFRYIVVVSQRAEQLINGAKVRTESRHPKPTLAAKDEVDAGEVSWRILTQEELDAQRQAVVEQFRAEVAGETAEAEAPIPDVLPTAEVVEAEEQAEERDEEVARLQRLLGIAGEIPVATDDESSEEPAGETEEEPEEVSLEDAEAELGLGDDEDDGLLEDGDEG